MIHRAGESLKTFLNSRLKLGTLLQESLAYCSRLSLKAKIILHNLFQGRIFILTQVMEIGKKTCVFRIGKKG